MAFPDFGFGTSIFLILVGENAARIGISIGIGACSREMEKKTSAKISVSFLDLTAPASSFTSFKTLTQQGNIYYGGAFYCWNLYRGNDFGQIARKAAKFNFLEVLKLSSENCSCFEFVKFY
jgi:hypothetical protein